MPGFNVSPALPKAAGRPARTSSARISAIADHSPPAVLRHWTPSRITRPCRGQHAVPKRPAPQASNEFGHDVPAQKAVNLLVGNLRVDKALRQLRRPRDGLPFSKLPRAAVEGGAWRQVEGDSSRPIDGDRADQPDELRCCVQGPSEIVGNEP